VEHKNKDPFVFRPYATCWFGTNHMPHTRDFSNALFRRALVLQFNNVFAGVNKDPNLKNKLELEIKGILNMALQAYGEALKRNDIIEPASSIIAKQDWLVESDQVAQFIGEMCFLDASERISSYSLYSEYQGWAKTAGITRQLNRKNFSKRLENKGCKLDRGTHGARMIAGIQINPVTRGLKPYQ
jgi:putative DNA primase/helicase